MKNKTFSVLGHIMNELNIPTTSMAQALHVDTSLISKWRTGSRQLNKNSVYFDEVIDFILNNDGTSQSSIIRVLRDLFPHEKFSDEHSIEYHLRYALSNENLTQIVEPAEIVFFDCEEFQWLCEDVNFSHRFVERLTRLLKKNFHATFIIHYSTSKENFRNFFNVCSSILFNSNVDWFYCQYYDDCFMNNSFIIINHAISMMCLSIDKINSNTMIFTDKNIVIQHEKMIKNTLDSYYPLFKSYQPFEVSTVIENIPRFKSRDSFLAFLPVPAFIGVNPELLKEVLSINNIEDSVIDNILNLNYHFRKITGIHYFETSKRENNTILIFQLEKMLERVYKKSFVSNSLSICCDRKIIIQPKYYAMELRNLAEQLRSNDGLKIVLASEKDYVSLPSINCWCMKNSYMLQMTKKGFRVCDESIAVNVASDAIEQCICRIPPERKEKSSVINFLLELADDLDSNC